MNPAFISNAVKKVGRLRVHSGWSSGTYQMPQKAEKTAFEKEVARLQLPEESWLYSETLRIWVKKHRNYKWVPEYLLIAWGIEVTGSCMGMV